MDKKYKNQESSYFKKSHCDRGLWHTMEPSKNPNYKSKLCLNWTHLGECKFGDRCAFAHGESELRKSKTIENFTIQEVDKLNSVYLIFQFIKLLTMKNLKLNLKKI